MKIRKGFVSNSSSASFVIAVKSKLTKSEIQDNLIDFLSEQYLEFFGEDSYNSNYNKQKLKLLINKTSDTNDIFSHSIFEIVEEDDTYFIEFFTSMYNDYSSFGEFCTAILYGLVCGDIYEMEFSGCQVESHN